MKKLLLLLLCLATLALAACQIPEELTDILSGFMGGTPSTPDSGTGDEEQPDGGNGNNGTGYLDPTHRTGTYKVEFKLYSKTVTHYYEEGEIPEPPTVEDAVEQLYVYVFSGWDKAVSPVTGATVYTAQFTQQEKIYTALFQVAGGRTIRVKAKAGTAPTPPVTPDFEGQTFVCWDKEIKAYYEDTTFTAVYVDPAITTVASMERAFNTAPITTEHHCFRDLHRFTAVYTLLLQEYKHPGGSYGMIAARVAEHLTSFVSNGNGMNFDCSTNWQYGVVAGVYAMAKKTPTVWNKIDYSTKSRIDTLMEGLAYIGSFGTSDYNDYKTGPSLGGNYRKSWNPNYRLGNIPGMAFITYYYGDGNLEAGAQKVNSLITSFNESTYTKMINRFTTYQWKGAIDAWTTEGIVVGGAVSTTSAKTLLISGGEAIAKSVDGTRLEGCGSGAGVSNGGRDYVYTGYQKITFTLYEADQILRDVIMYNFSGGTVKSEHWYEGQRVGWIYDDTKSPYEGMEGMMLEFASGNRSSTVYFDHDFTMVGVLLSIARELVRYDEKGKIETDAFGNPVALYDCTQDVTMWTKIQVGMEDFLYKNIHEYMSYSTGSYGESWGVHGEKDSSAGYYYVKDLWRSSLLPLGTIEAAK